MQFTNEFNGDFRMNEPPSVQLPDLMDFISVEQQSSNTNTNTPPSNNKPTQFKFTEMTMENTAPQIKRPNHNNNNNNPNNNNNVIIIDVPKPKPNHYPLHQQQHQPHQQPFNNSGGFVSEGMNPVIHANFDEPTNPPSTNAADFKAKLERRRKGLNKSNNQP